MGDVFWQGIADHLKAEWALVMGAPVVFMLAVLGASALLYFVVRGHFSERLETQTARIGFLGDQLAEYKTRLSGASPAEAAQEIAALKDDLSAARTEIRMLVDWQRHQTNDRRVNDAQAAIIVEGLKDFPAEFANRIEFSSVNQPEPQQYALDIQKTFDAAGVSIKYNAGNVIMITSPDEVGVLLVVPDDTDPPDHAKRLFEVLCAAGVEVHYDKFESPGWNGCTLMVSYKPPMKLAC